MNRFAAGKFPPSEYPEYRRNPFGMAADPDRLSAALSEGFCAKCRILLQQRLRLFFTPAKNPRFYPVDFSPENYDHDCYSEISSYSEDYDTPERRYRRCRSPKRISYRADRERGGYSPTVNRRKRGFYEYSDADLILDDGIARFPSNCDDDGISEEQKEKLRFLRVRKEEFVHLERIDGKLKNILQGLELHTGVFNQEEQNNIVDFVYHLQSLGQRGQLRNSTYSEPKKWMRGKGRVTIQFGCCYNYAMDKKGTPPGIVRDEEVDPLPYLFKKMIKRMVKWHILPNTCVPDSCIVNIYDEGDCIPPHIDHHDFLRPFCTVSFLTETDILFGSQLEILSPGEFSGPVSIPLPKGSVFILSGNGADLAKHCVPSVSAKRISITFRKMDDRKLPFRFLPDLELQRIKPLDLSQLKEEEKKNVELEDVKIKQRDYHQYYSPKPLNLLSQFQEEEKKNVKVKEGKRKQRHYHYDDSLDSSHLQKGEYNVGVREWERKQRGHRQSKRQRTHP